MMGRRRALSLYSVWGALLAYICFTIGPAWAIYRQQVELTSETGEEIPKTSISFAAESGEEVAIEEDEDDPNVFWLVFPGDRASGGALTIERAEGPVEIAVPDVGLGEKVVIDLDTASVSIAQQDYGQPHEPSQSDVAETDAVDSPADGTGIAEATEAVEEAHQPYDISKNLEPIEIGPRSEVGTKSVGKKVLEGAAGKALGGLLGGGGSRRSSSRSSEPKTKRDPTRKDDPVTAVDAETGAAVGVRAKWTDDGLLFSTNIDESDDRGTFHYVYLVDENGRELAPNKIDIYKIWRKTTLTVSWTRSEYVDGALVSQTSGGWSESWTDDLGLFTRGGEGDGAQAPGIWQLAGYGRAHAGLRRIGTTFDLTPEEFAALGKVHLIVHISRPSLDPVITAPFAMSVAMNPAGNINLAPYAP